METIISFPGLGINPFTVYKELFSIGPVSVRWYGVLITFGMVLAFLYTTYRAKSYQISFDTVIDFTLPTIIFAIIGARLFYVLNSLHLYHSFWDVFKIWEGGLAIYGGVIGGALTIIICCKIRKVNMFQLLDATAPGVMLAQAIGRWGNFCNGEAYGAEVTGGPLYFLRMGISPHYDITTVSQSQLAFVHPTFLYESMWNLLGFALINIFYKKKKFDGEVVLWYATWYGFGRFFIEMLRTDSLFIPGTSLKISCAIGLVCFAVGLVLILFFRYRARVQKSAEKPYVSMFGQVATEPVEGVASTEKPEQPENEVTETENQEENQKYSSDNEIEEKEEQTDGADY